MNDSGKVQLLVFLILIMFSIFIGRSVAHKGNYLILFVVIGIIGIFLAFIRPFTGLIIMILLVPLINPSLRISQYFNLYLINLSTYIIIIGFATRIFLVKDYVLNITIIDVQLSLYVLILIINVVMIPNKQVSYMLYIKRLIAVFSFVGMYYVGANLFVDLKMIKKVIYVLIVSGVTASIYGYIQFLFIPFKGTPYRAYAALHNPNHLANHLIMIIPFALGFMNSDYKKKSIMYLSFIIMFIGILATKSRAGLLSLMIILLFYAIKSRIKLIAISLIVIIVIFIITVPAFTSRFRGMGFIDLLVHSPRYVIWGNSISIIRDNLLLGKGVGQLTISSLPYDSKIWDGTFNIFLTAFAELGFIGFILLLWLYKKILEILRILIQDLENFELFDDIYAISFGLYLGLIGFLFHSLVEDNIYAVMNNWLFGLLIGLTVSIERLLPDYQEKVHSSIISENTKKLL